MVVVEEDGRVRRPLELRSSTAAAKPAFTAAYPSSQARWNAGRPSACTRAPTASAGRTTASGSRRRCSTSRTPARRARPGGAIRRAVASVSSSVCTRDGTILLGDRARDPRDVVVRRRGCERGHEAAAAPLRDPVAAGVAAVRHRPAVRDDDQLAAHGPEAYTRYGPAAATTGELGAGRVVAQSRLKSTSQSRSSRGVRKWRRTYSFPLSARCRAVAGIATESRCTPPRTPSTELTSQPVSPSWICATIPPTRPATVGPRLPERLGHGQPEPLPDRLLDDGRGMHLERVDLDGAHVVQVGQDVDVGVAAGVRDGLVVEVPALRIVVRHRADERELHVRDTAASPAGTRR